MRADFLFPWRARGESESEQGTGREGHVFVPCQKHASSPFLGWNAHSKRQELREGGGRTSGSTGLEQKSYPRTPAYSSALGSDVYCTWLINARERREGGSCVSQTCDVEAKRLGHGQSPDERGWGMSLGATAFLGDLGIPRMSSECREVACVDA